MKKSGKMMNFGMTDGICEFYSTDTHWTNGYY